METATSRYGLPTPHPLGSLHQNSSHAPWPSPKSSAVSRARLRGKVTAAPWLWPTDPSEKSGSLPLGAVVVGVSAVTGRTTSGLVAAGWVASGW